VHAHYLVADNSAPSLGVERSFGNFGGILPLEWWDEGSVMFDQKFVGRIGKGDACLDVLPLICLIFVIFVLFGMGGALSRIASVVSCSRAS